MFETGVKTWADTGTTLFIQHINSSVGQIWTLVICCPCYNARNYQRFSCIPENNRHVKENNKPQTNVTFYPPEIQTGWGHSKCKMYVNKLTVWATCLWNQLIYDFYKDWGYHSNFITLTMWAHGRFLTKQTWYTLLSRHTTTVQLKCFIKMGNMSSHIWIYIWIPVNGFSGGLSFQLDITDVYKWSAEKLSAVPWGMC